MWELPAGRSATPRLPPGKKWVPWELVPLLPGQEMQWPQPRESCTWNSVLCTLNNAAQDWARQKTRLKVDPKPLFFSEAFLLQPCCLLSFSPLRPHIPATAVPSHVHYPSFASYKHLPLPTPEKFNNCQNREQTQNLWRLYDTTTRRLQSQLSVLQKEEKQRLRPISFSCEPVPGGFLPKPGLCTARHSPRTCGAMTKAGS